MKLAVGVLLLAAAAAADSAAGDNPVQKVLELLSSLQSKVIEDGEASQKVYEEFAGACKDRSIELHQNIKTAKALAEEQQASIEQASDTVAVSTTKIEELSSAISSDEKDLKAATAIRKKEAADFTAADKELKGTIDTLDRAISIVEREANKAGSSFVQSSGKNLAQALSAMVEASSLDSADGARLTALLQNSQSAESEDEEYSSLLSAPEESKYESHSSGLVETLDSLLDKAQTQLDDLRQTEVTARNNFEMLKQSLEDKIKNNGKDLTRAKKTKAEADESKAAFEKALKQTEKSIAEDKEDMSQLHHECMSRATDYEEETASQGEELKALAEAKKIITESTGGAESLTYGGAAAALLQVRQQRAGPLSASLGAVRIVRDLAFKGKSPALAQLASRLEEAVHRRADLSSSDVFGKVKDLISSMIEKLNEEAESEATHKAHCDKEMSETATSLDEKTADIEKLTSKIADMTAENQQLNSEIATASKELNEIARFQANADKIRQEEKAVFVKSKADLEQGIKGIQLALKILRDYYAKSDKDHEAGEGAGGGIIGMLEVAESDFSKGLSEAVAEEEVAAAAYEEQTKENAILKVTKEQDRDYKTKASKGLEKSLTELSSDRASSQSELDAVNLYMDKLKEGCIAKAEPYEERKRRREEELAGLGAALKLLDTEPALLQHRVTRTRRSLRSLRGVGHLHGAAK